jgi:hypothetical protein
MALAAWARLALTCSEIMIATARSLMCAVASSMAGSAAPSVSGRASRGDSVAWLSAGAMVSVIMILRAGRRRWPAVASKVTTATT